MDHTGQAIGQKKTNNISPFCLVVLDQFPCLFRMQLHKQFCWCREWHVNNWWEEREVGGNKPELLKPVSSPDKFSWTHSSREQSLSSSLKWLFFQNSLFCVWRSSHWTSKYVKCVEHIYKGTLDSQFMGEMWGVCSPTLASHLQSPVTMQPPSSTDIQLLVWQMCLYQQQLKIS